LIYFQVDKSLYYKTELCHHGAGGVEAAHEIHADTEAGAGTNRGGNRGSKEVENREGGGGDDTDCDDLLNPELLAGNQVGGDRDHETLENILENAHQ